MLPIPDSIQMRLVLVLVHFLWQATLIAALLAGSISLLRIRSPRVKYAASLLSLMLMAACPVATWIWMPMDAVNANRQSTSRATPRADGNKDAGFTYGSLLNEKPADSPQTSLELNRLELDEGRLAPSEMSSMGRDRAGDGNALNAGNADASQYPGFSRDTLSSGLSESKPAWWQPAAPWIVSVWLIGVVVLSLRLLLGAWGTWRWRQQLEPLPKSLAVLVDQLCGLLGMRVPRVAISSRVTEAVAIGLLRPLVLLPAAWVTSIPPDMLEGILAHELAHIRRYDLWVNLFQRVVETLFFYHPAVWWLSNRLRSEREFCCDDLAVSVTQDDVRYAEMLEHVGRMKCDGRPSPIAVSISHPRHALLERVRHVLRLGAPDDTRGSSLAAALLLTMAVLTGALLTSKTMLSAGEWSWKKMHQSSISQDRHHAFFLHNGKQPAFVVVRHDPPGTESSSNGLLSTGTKRGGEFVHHNFTISFKATRDDQPLETLTINGQAFNLGEGRVLVMGDQYRVTQLPIHEPDMVTKENLKQFVQDAVAQAEKLTKADKPQEAVIAIEPKPAQTDIAPFQNAEAGTTYRGRIVTEDGSPLPAGLKLMRRVSSEETRETAVDAKGEFAFQTDPQNGSVRFSIKVEGFAPFDSEWMKLDKPLILTLSRGAAVTLRMKAPDGAAPLSGKVRLIVRWYDDDEQGEFPVDPQGVVTIAHCPKRTVDFDVRVPGYEELRIHRPVQGNLTLDIPLTPAKPTRMRIVSVRNGRPIAGARLQLFSRTRAGSFLTPYRYYGNDEIWGVSNADGLMTLTTLRAIDPVPTNDPGAAIYAFRIDAPGHAPRYIGDVRAGADLGDIALNEGLEVRGEVIHETNERVSLQVRQPTVAQGGVSGLGDWLTMPTVKTNGKTTFHLTNLQPGPFDLFIVYSDTTQPPNSPRGNSKQLPFRGTLTASSSNLKITRESVTPGDGNLTSLGASLFTIDDDRSNVPSEIVRLFIGDSVTIEGANGKAVVQETKPTLPLLFAWSNTAPMQHSMGHVSWSIFVLQDGTVFIPGGMNRDAGLHYKLSTTELAEFKTLLEKHRDLFGRQVPKELPQFAGWRHGHQTLYYTNKEGVTKAFTDWTGVEDVPVAGEFDSTGSLRAISDYLGQLMSDAHCGGRESKARYRDLANKALSASLPQATPFNDSAWTNTVNETDGTRTIRFANTDENTEVTLIHPAFGDVYVERIAQHGNRIAFAPKVNDGLVSQAGSRLERPRETSKNPLISPGLPSQSRSPDPATSERDEPSTGPPLPQDFKVMVEQLSKLLPQNWRHPRVVNERTIEIMPGMYLFSEERPHVIVAFTDDKARPKVRYEREDEQYEYLGETQYGHAHLFVSMRISREDLGSLGEQFAWPEAVDFLKAFLKRDAARIETFKKKADDRDWGRNGYGPIQNGMRVKWSFTPVRFAPPVNVALTVYNYGEQTRTFDLDQFNAARSWVLTGPDGRPVPLRNAAPPREPRPYKLEPNHSTHLDGLMDLAQLFDVSKPGRYVLSFHGSRVQTDTTGFVPSSDDVLPAALDLVFVIPDKEVQQRIDDFQAAILAQGMGPDLIPLKDANGAARDVKFFASAAPEKFMLMVGEPTWIHFKVMNQTNTDKRAIVGGDYRNALGRPNSFKVDVFDADGQRVAQPDIGIDMGGGVHAEALPSKQHLLFKLFLPHWATITKPGQYRMTIWRELEIVQGEAESEGKSPFVLLDREKIMVAAETTFTVVPPDEARFGDLIERLGPKLIGENSDDSERANTLLQAIRVPVEWSQRAASALDAEVTGRRVAGSERSDGPVSPTTGPARWSDPATQIFTGLVPDERAVPWYVKYLAQSQGSRKQTALRFLAHCRSETACRAIVKAFDVTASDITDTTMRDLAESSARAVHHSAALALATFVTNHPEHPEATSKLFSLANSSHMPVRLTVLHFCATNKSPEARKVIDTMTSDKDKTLATEAKRYQELLAIEDSKTMQAEQPAPRTQWSVKGRVVDGDGNPVTGVIVQAATGVGSLKVSGKGETDADGRYEFTFGPGFFGAKDGVGVLAATITARKAGYFEKNLSRQGDLLMAQTLPEKIGWGNKTKDDVILPGQPRELNFVMLPAAKLSGTLIDENEKPLVGYGLSLTGKELPPSSSVLDSTKTDETGRFTFSDIPTGFPFQLLVEPAREKSKGKVWAGGPFEFLAKPTVDLAIKDGERVVTANRFELQIKGSGVSWKEALRTTADHQKLVPTGDTLSSKSTLSATFIRLELSSFVRGSPDPAQPPTEGLPLQEPNRAASPEKTGDLRSEPRRGQETRAEQEKVSVQGRVMIDGPIPDVPLLRIKPTFRAIIPRNQEEGLRNEEREKAAPVVEIPDDTLVISKEGGIANVAIYLRKAPKDWKPTPPPSEPVLIEAAKHRFTPHFSFIRTGQPLKLVNSMNEAVTFHPQLMRGVTQNLVLESRGELLLGSIFTKPESLPNQFTCGIHPWMVGYLLALDHPFAAITDADGRFEIRSLPPGEHHFTVWHERRGYLNRDLVIRVEEDKVSEVDLKYTAEQLERRAEARVKAQQTGLALLPEHSNPDVVKLLKQFQDHFAQQRFAEAELAAIQAIELDSANETLERLRKIAIYARRLGSEKDHPQRASLITIAFIDQLMKRQERVSANDREAAAKLVGRWMLTVSEQHVYPAEITQGNDGLLLLTGVPKNVVLWGRYAVTGDRLELVEPNDPLKDDFVWQIRSSNKLSLVVSKSNNNSDYTGARLERLAEAPRRVDEKKDQPGAIQSDSVYRIPAQAVEQAKRLAAEARSKRTSLKQRRPAGLEELDNAEAIRHAAERAMRELADEKTNESALSRLEYLGDDAFDVIVAGTKSENPLVARLSCRALQHRGKKAVKPLCDVVDSHAELSVREMAISTLGQTFESECVPSLIRALEVKELQTSAMFALAYPRDERAIEPLRKLANNPVNGHVATQTIRHIQSSHGINWCPPESRELLQLCRDAHTLKGESFGPSEYERLLFGLKSESENSYRCLFALGAIDAVEAVPAIVGTPSSEMKFHVLAQIGTPDALEHIIQRLHSLNQSTREVTVLGLADGADRWAAPILVALLDDPSLTVPEKKNSNDPLGLNARVDPLGNWPESHKAHSALNRFFSRFGLKEKMLNLASGETNNVPEEIDGIRKWWHQHGDDFLAGKAVPNPGITSVGWYR